MTTTNVVVQNKIKNLADELLKNINQEQIISTSAIFSENRANTEKILIKKVGALIWQYKDLRFLVVRNDQIGCDPSFIPLIVLDISGIV